MAVARHATIESGHPRPAWLSEELYQFRDRYLEIGGNLVHYVDEGAGSPLLLLTAGPTWSFLFRNVIREVRGQFRCIALDAPGQGLSEAAPDFPFTIAATSEVVELFVEALEVRDLTLLAHDLGGPIGLSMAARRADLIRALVITDTFCFPIGDLPRPARMLRFVSGPIFGSLNANFNYLPTSWHGAARDAAGRRRPSGQPT